MPARRLAALLLLLCPSSALWATLGRDAFRTSAQAGALPGRAGAASVTAAVLGAGAAYSRFSPLVSAGTVAAVSAGGCNVSFFSLPAHGADGAWSPCAGGGGGADLFDPFTVGASLAGGAGGLWLSATAARGAVGLAAARGAARAPLFSAPLPLAPVAGPLVRNCTATWVGARGAVAVTELGPWCDGAPPAGAPAPPRTALLADAAALCAPGDAVAKAATALPGGGFLVASRAGCVTAFDDRGRRAWGAALALNGSLVAADAVVDAAGARAFFVSDGGLVACASLAAPAPGGACAGWPAGSAAQLPRAALPVRSGLALSPPTADFHGGQLYATDAAGALFVIATASGAVGSSAAHDAFRAGSPAYAAPALVVGAWGAGRSGLVLVAAGGRNSSHGGACAAAAGRTPACVIALAVGSNGAGRDDDDARDDDGAATTGRQWALALGAGVVANASGLAVGADGTLYVPTSRGLVVLAARAAPPPPRADGALVVGLAVGAGLLGALAAAGAGAAVARARARARAEAAGGGGGAYRALDAADEQGGLGTVEEGTLSEEASRKTSLAPSWAVN